MGYYLILFSEDDPMWIETCNNTQWDIYIRKNIGHYFILIPALCIFYFVLWPTKAQLFHKLSYCYMFRHYRIILRELVINTFKYLCNLARYWLQAPWGWHDSVETRRSVIIYEIIVHLLVIVQNKKKDKIQNKK